MELVHAPTDASTVAQRVIERLVEPHSIDGHEWIVPATIGVAISPLDGNEPDQLLISADLALYDAKRHQRGEFRFFEQGLDTTAREQRTMENDLRTALAYGELTLHYQPIVNLKTHRVSSCECLLRWDHPTKGRVPPAEFIPIAEATGLIGPIGKWVLFEACKEAVNWPAEIKVAVNLSPIQFKFRCIVQDVIDALAASGLSPSRLELEITESALLSDGDATVEILEQLRNLGVSIALDDFGTGYSSLSYLHRFQFSKLKIDRCFIGDLGKRDGHAMSILQMVAQLGSKLGMTVTAEGVETEEQQKIVRDEGCTEMQGYLYSRPVDANTLREFIARRRIEHAYAA